LGKPGGKGGGDFQDPLQIGGSLIFPNNNLMPLGHIECSPQVPMNLAVAGIKIGSASGRDLANKQHPHPLWADIEREVLLVSASRRLLSVLDCYALDLITEMSIDPAYEC
jgi:hypothetical protein